jgi:catechol 2,3-dioxygenase-like lactoylglutathione lyase family enzyme
VHISNITFDCDDPHPLAAFWTEVLGFREDPQHDDAPGVPEGLLNLRFIKLPESPTVKSGRRLDLVPTERSQEEEVDRLLRFGASLVADHRQPDGKGWVVLADPEGNEFTVQRNAAEGGHGVSATASASKPARRIGFMAAARGWLNRRVERRSASRAESSAVRTRPSPLARVGRFLSHELVRRLRQLIRLVLLVMEAFIAVRILFKVAGANEHAGFASLLYKVTAPLVGPFHPVFADRLVSGHPFEWGSLLAMPAYAALAYLALRLVRLVSSPEP